MVITLSERGCEKACLTNFGGEFVIEGLGVSRTSTHCRLTSFSLPVLGSLFLFAERDILPSGEGFL